MYLWFRTKAGRANSDPTDVLMSVLARKEEEVGRDVQKGSLMHSHRSLAHLNYGTIVRIAQDPDLGILLTDQIKANCLPCAKIKQTKNAKKRKDTGDNSLIDVVCGVICSDLKGPMNPKDRLGNRYMIKFVDHRTNYCRIFLANEDIATQKFKHFMDFLSISSIAESTC